MNLTVSGHHLDVTQAIRDHVEEVTLIVEKHQHKAEANLHLAGADLFASSESDDMYLAIDSLADKLDRQVIKYKEKHRGH